MKKEVKKEGKNEVKKEEKKVVVAVLGGEGGGGNPLINEETKCNVHKQTPPFRRHSRSLIAKVPHKPTYKPLYEPHFPSLSPHFPLDSLRPSK